MREIKFRAWDKNLKGWIAEEFFITKKGELFIMRGHVGVKLNDKDVILVQYTGLKDRNGQEIYEGDVIVPAHPQLSGVGFAYGKPRVVTFRLLQSSTGFNIGGGQKKRKEFISLGDKTNTEIMGDIYRNPELAKQLK